MLKNNFKFDIEKMKREDKIYLKELQLFFDKVDNVKDDELRSDILRQMHICEQRIILMCEKVLNENT